jgi:enhancing lycopene biosynthesis protein 2
MKRIAVLLSGCGNKDGAEVTEAVCLMVALAQLNCELQFYSLNKDIHPVNHLDGSVSTSETRNLLIETARITRGVCLDIVDLKAKDHEALVIVGGQGAAKHFSNWAEKKSQAQVQTEVQKAIQEFHKLQKPIGAICIAPAVVACALRGHKITITLGENPDDAAEVMKTGCEHIDCPSYDFVSDRDHKIISTPAYMNKSKPHLVFQGISGLAQELVEMA